MILDQSLRLYEIAYSVRKTINCIIQPFFKRHFQKPLAVDRVAVTETVSEYCTLRNSKNDTDSDLRRPGSTFTAPASQDYGTYGSVFEEAVNED
jgi:hypothetical protein